MIEPYDMNMMNELARRLEEVADVVFERDMNGDVVTLEYSTFRNGVRVDGWYFKVGREPGCNLALYSSLSDSELRILVDAFPMEVNGVEFRYGNFSQPEFEDGRIRPAALAFY